MAKKTKAEAPSAERFMVRQLCGPDAVYGSGALLIRGDAWAAVDAATAAHLRRVTRGGELLPEGAVNVAPRFAVLALDVYEARRAEAEAKLTEQAARTAERVAAEAVRAHFEAAQVEAVNRIAAEQEVR